MKKDKQIAPQLKTKDISWDKVAVMIKNVDIPVVKRTPEKALGESNDPQDWVDNYAEGIARGGIFSKEEASQKIRQTFEKKYRCSPEEMLERKKSRGRDR